MINESKTVMPINTLSRFTVGDQIVRYLIDSESQCVGLEIIPRSMGNLVVGRREFLDEPALASLPAPGSVMPRAPIASPVTIFGSHLRLSSSLPHARM